MSALSNALLQPLPELVGPDYNVYRLRSDFFKIVKFKSTAPRVGRTPKVAAVYKHSSKLDASISRARRVCLEIALSNDWKWFATFTIAKNNFDRKNLDGFYLRFKEWLKYRRKKLGIEIPYLLVPEQHGDGSWHMHGFFNSDVDSLLVSFRDLDKQGYRSDDGKRLPRKLIKNDYYDCPDYRKRFGFCSFGQIKNRDAAAFYVTKYISKSFLGGARRVGLDLYFTSQHLNRGVLFDSIYGPCPDLDRWLVNDYEYCRTGFYHFQREPGDDPLLDILESQHTKLFSIDNIDPATSEEVDKYYDVVQQVMKGFFV